MSQQPPPPGPAAPLEALPLIGVGGAATFVWFQDVCAAILRATPTYSAVEQIGVVGDDQEGLDIRATFEQRDPWGFQCKQEAQFGPADVTKAITEVPVDPSYRATQYRILLARNATAGARARARETAGWDIIDAADLNEMIRALPLDTKVELVRRFWGAVWVERALGVARTATFAAPERFYAPFLNHDLTLNHDRPLHGRANDLAQMTTWVGGTAKALIVSGRSGIGVSRLILEFTRVADRVIVMPLSGGAIDPEGLNEIAAGPVIVVVDHDDLERLAPLLSLIAADQEKRLIIGCGRGQVQAYLDALLTAGVAPAGITQVRLSALGRNDTIDLAREVVPGLNDDYAEAVVSGAGETPLSSVATAAMYGAQTVEARVAIYTEVTARQRDLIKGNITDEAPAEHVRLALALVAALGPVRLGDPNLYAAAAAFNLDFDDLNRAVGAIRNAGGFAERGDRLEVAPTLVRDGVLIQAATTGQTIGPFARTLYEAVNFNKRLFANMASANDAATAIGRPAFFDPLWDQAQRDAIAIDYARRQSFVEAARGVAPFKANDVVRTLRHLHRTLPANDTQQFGFILQVTAAQVDKEIATVLGDVLQRNAPLVNTIVPVLWDICGDDQRNAAQQPEAGLRILREAMDYDGAHPDVRNGIVDWVERMLANPGPEKRHSVVEILEPALALQYEKNRTRGDHFQIAQHFVILARVAAFRDRVLAVVLPAVIGPSDRTAMAAIKMTASLLRYVNVFSNDQADLARLTEEQNRILDAFEQIVNDGSQLRKLWLRDQLIMYSRRADAIGGRIQALIERIVIEPQGQLLRAASPALAQHWVLDPNAPHHGITLHETQLQQERQAVAEGLMHDCPDATTLRDRLEGTVNTLAAAGIDSHLPPLIAVLVSVDFDRMVDVARNTEAQPAAPIVAASLAPVIGAALERAPAVGAELLAQFQHGSEYMRAVAAIALTAPLANSDLASDEVQHRLAATILAINDNDPRVRQHARSAAARLAKAVPAVVPVLVDAYSGVEGETIDWIFTEVPITDDGDIEMDGQTYERIVRPLVNLRSLEYFALRLLGAGLGHFSPTVIAVLEARYRRPYESGVQAVPHDPSLRDFAAAVVRHGRVGEIMSMLSRVRDTSLRDYDIGALVGHLWELADVEVRAAIRGILATRNASEIRAIPQLFGAGDLVKLVDDSDLLVAIVEGAFDCGYEVGTEVTAALKRGFLFRPHVRTGREHTPELLQLAASCEAALQRVDQASDSEAFFADLLYDVQAELEREGRDDDDAFGPE